MNRLRRDARGTPTCSALALLVGVAASILALAANAADAGCDAACQAARKAQDPLAPIAGVLTDFTSTFGPDTWSSSTRNDNYQFQPVYSFENIDGRDANLILRGIVPLNSVPSTTGGSRTTGIGDSLLQGFYVPPGQSEKFAIGGGPQISVPTHTNSELEGAGWGAGAVLVGFGGTGPWIYGGILAQLWGQNDTSQTVMNPIVFYNWSLLGGSYIGYANTITYNWRADSGDRWNVPVGLTVGKAFTLDNSHIIDVNLGVYAVPTRPSGSGDRQIKWAVSWIIP